MRPQHPNSRLRAAALSRRCFIGGGMAWLGTAAAAECPQKGPLSASFVQPWEQHIDYGLADWTRLAETLADLGISGVHLQWAKIPTRHKLVDVGSLLRVCEAARMRLVVGLAGTEKPERLYYSSNDTKVTLAEYRSASLQVARRLAPIVAGSPSFAGWYLPEEPDDLMFESDARVRGWVTHLAALARELRTLVPGAGVSMSTYVSGRMTAEQFAAAWKQIWQSAPGLQLLVQDGFGVRFLPECGIAAYVQVLREVARGSGGRLGLVIEVFEQLAGHPIDAAEYRDRPATIERLRRQIQLAQTWPELPLVAYSAVEHMLPTLGPQHADLAKSYVAEFVRRGCAER